MKPCIQDQVKNFINNFVNLRMDLSNNNGPTVEYTIVKTKNGWSSGNVKDWILENLSLDISNWISVFKREEKSSSGSFLTERFLDNHWVFANREKIGLRYWDSKSSQYAYEVNGSIFPYCEEYFNMQGIFVGDNNTRSPKTFLMPKSRLDSWYNLLNTGKYYIDQGGAIQDKPSDMTAKEFLSEYSTSLVNPSIEYGNAYYRSYSLIQSISQALKGADGKTAYRVTNLSETLATNGLFNDTGTLWDIIELHSRMQGRVPICNSIWGIGSVDDISDAEWNEEIPVSSVSSSVDTDLMGGRGQNIIQSSKLPGRYPNDKNNDAESGKDTKVWLYNGSLARRTVDGVHIGGSLNHRMYQATGFGSYAAFIEDPALFGLAVLSQTQIFSEAVTIWKMCNDHFVEVAERFEDGPNWHFYKNFHPWLVSEKGDNWLRVPLSEDGKERKNPTDEEVIGACRWALGTGEWTDRAPSYFAALWPNGYNASSNNVQKVINFWSEYSRYYFQEKFTDEYGRTSYGFPYGSTESYSNGQSKNYVALQIFGSQQMNQGSKEWKVMGEGSLMWIDGKTKFKDSPFWRFNSNTSNAGDLEEEEEAAGANDEMYKVMGSSGLIQIQNLSTGEWEGQQYAFIDMGAESVPTFEDILHQYKDTVWFEVDNLRSDEYHKISVGGEYYQYGAAHFNGNIEDALQSLHGKMSAWASFQEDKDGTQDFYSIGQKETDLSKVNMSGSLNDDSSEEDQKSFINPRVRNNRITRSRQVMNCSHPINMDYELYNINSEYSSSDSNSLVLTEDGWEQLSILKSITSDQCPNFSINRKSFSLINELYALNQTDIKALESINFSVQGGTLKVDYSFSNAQIIPDYRSLIGARFAFNKIVK